MGKAENDQLRASSGMQLANHLPPKCGREHRRETRYMVSWRAAVSVDGQNFHYGRLRDISLKGAAILDDLNVKPGTCVMLKIHIPGLDISCGAKVVIARSIATYTVYDTEHQCFRMGVSFDVFEQASDRAYLEGRLTNHHTEVPGYICRRSTDQTIALH